MMRLLYTVLFKPHEIFYILFSDSYQKKKKIIPHTSRHPRRWCTTVGLTFTVVSKIVPVDLLLKPNRRVTALYLHSQSTEDIQVISLCPLVSFTCQTLFLYAVRWLTAKRYIRSSSRRCRGFISFLKHGLYWLIGNVETRNMDSARDQLPPGDVVIITAAVAAGVGGLCCCTDKSSAPF